MFDFDLLVIDTTTHHLITRRSFDSTLHSPYHLDRVAYSLDFELNAAKNAGLTLAAFRETHMADALPRNTTEIDHLDLATPIRSHDIPVNAPMEREIAQMVADGILRCTSIDGDEARVVPAETWR